MDPKIIVKSQLDCNARKKLSMKYEICVKIDPKHAILCFMLYAKQKTSISNIDVKLKQKRMSTSVSDFFFLYRFCEWMSCCVLALGFRQKKCQMIKQKEFK